jgi:hypothetical protein
MGHVADDTIFRRPLGGLAGAADTAYIYPLTVAIVLAHSRGGGRGVPVAAGC